MSAVRSLVRRVRADIGGTEARLLTGYPFGTQTDIPSNGAQWSTDSGEPISELRALQASAVQACVRVLADGVNGLPFAGYRLQGDLMTRMPVQPTLLKQDTPFLDYTFAEGIFATIASLALRGDAFWFVVERDVLEYPTRLMILHPDMVGVQTDRDTGRVVYKVAGNEVPRSDIIHMRRFTLPGMLYGLSPIAAAAQSIGLSLAAERYGARWFGDSANPSAVLESDVDVDEDTAKRTLKSWVQSHGGHRHPAMLSGGLKYHNISITPDEAQFLETRKFQRSEIAMIFGVPPHMIGDQSNVTSWGSGIEQIGIGYVRYNLRTWVRIIQDAFTGMLPRGQYSRADLKELTRAETKARYEAYVLARNAGWMNVDEIRANEDLAPLPDGKGQDYIQPLNMGPLGIDPTKDQPPPPATPPEGDGS